MSASASVGGSAPVIERRRIQEEFLELCSIPSPSRQEGRIARRLEAILKAMGASVDVDDAGEKIGGDTGNILARIPGTTPGAPALLLSSHMDTVGPAERITTVIEGDIVRTDRTSVLGGDDKSGIAAILEAIRVVRERAIPHGEIEVLLTICEESGLIGARHFDASRLHARRGLVLDVDGVGELITRAPAANRLLVSIDGLEAHAGICPERGISAIQVAAEAIAGMRLGRLDAETTANIGVIHGGVGSNIVPNRVTLHGETRRLDDAKLRAQTEHMRRCVEDAAARHSAMVDGRERRARAAVEIERHYDRLDVPDQAAIVRMAKGAAAALGRALPTRSTGGGSDANVFAARGIEVANLACGMRDIHTLDEWVDVRDLVSTAELLVELIRLNATPPAAAR